MGARVLVSVGAVLALLLDFATAQPRTVQAKNVNGFATPLSIQRDDQGAVHVSLCSRVNLTLSAPSAAFFGDLVGQSGCNMENATQKMELSQLAAEMREETDEEVWRQPGGFMIHAIRVGSTAAANMAGGHPDAVILKEPSAFAEVLLWFKGTQEEQQQQQQQQQRHPPRRREAILALRLVAHLFFRAAASQRLSLLLQDGIPDARDRAGQTSIIVKLASSGTVSSSQLALLREAFPNVPFAYLIREPAASLASLTLSPSSSVIAASVLDSPCLRWRGLPAAQQLPGLLDIARSTDPLDLSVEQYCAAHLYALHDSMLTQIESDEVVTRGSARPKPLVIDHTDLPDAIWQHLLPAFGFDVDESVRARCLEYGTFDAKDTRKVGYTSKVPSDAAKRWAVAYTQVTYTQLHRHASRGGELSNNTKAAIDAAHSAAAAARANTSAGVGRYSHTAGITGAPPLRPCTDGNRKARNSVEAAEFGMNLYAHGDVLGGEACWALALRLQSSEPPNQYQAGNRVAVLQNLADVEGVLSREDSRRIRIGQVEPSPSYLPWPRRVPSPSYLPW